MPVNGFTVGRDITVTISGPGNNSIVISSDQVTMFDAKPGKKEVWSRPLNVPPQPVYMPDGWRGTIHVDRSDATLDTFLANLELNYWNGENTLPGSVLETITEDDGSVTQWQFPLCMFWVDDPGSYHADGLVVQRLEFCCGTRKRVA